MPLDTKHYNLASFLQGDIYSSLSDYRRFTTLDIQLSRIANIIQDGVAYGLDIADSGFPNITISAGSAIIDKFIVNKFNDTNLTLESNETYKLYLQRRVGVLSSISPRSDLAHTAYIDTGPPAQPASFVAQLNDENPYFNIDLSWDADNSIDFAKYEIYRSTSASEHFELIQTIDNVNTTSATDTTADEDVQYFYRLYAIDLSGNYSVAATTDITTELSPQLPPNPSNVVMRPSEYAINVLWERPLALSFEKVHSYKISYTELNSDGSEIENSTLIFTVNRNAYYDRIDNLDNGKTYKVTISTIDTRNRQSAGIWQNVIPQPRPSAPDPLNIRYTESEGPNGARINLQWEPGDNEYDSAVSYRYNIYVQVSGANESLAINVPAGLTSEQIDLYTFDLIQYHQIPQNTLLTIRITSVTADGYESMGSFVKFTTQQFSTPTQLTGSSASFEINDGKIIVTWNYNSETSNIHIHIDSENLNDEYGTQETIVNDFIGLTTTYVFDAKLDYKYTITVTPYNSHDMAGTSETIVQLTLIQGGLPLPALPQNLYAKAGDRKLILTWAPSTSGYTSHYKIYRRQGRISLTASHWTLIDTLPSTMTTFTDYGLENDDVWSYYVTAYDVYEREGLHLIDGAINLNFVEAIPRKSGILTEPDNIQLELIDNDITVTWDSLIEEFDVFAIYRTINNLHSWELIRTVDKNTTSIIDENVALIDGYTYYYAVEKIINDCDIKVYATTQAPENSILIGEIETDTDSLSIDTSNVRQVASILSTLEEYSDLFIKEHAHKELKFFDPTRIDLNPELIISDWTTRDGRIFTTNELDISGTGHIVKVNDRFPSVLYEIDTSKRRLVFAEPIVTFDDTTGEIAEPLPNIEVKVLGVEETTGVLPSYRFDNIHARQVAFGKLPENQLPDIGHEGRIKERLLPETFLLERFDNHTFVVPENTTDETKTFGNGTTFYCVTDSNGLIDSVVDFEQFADSSQVLFRSPRYSSITSAYLDASYDIAEVTSLTGFQSVKSYHIQFAFADASEVNWLHLTTFDADNLPNPIIDLRKKIRFRIKIAEGSLYVALGVREITNISAEVGNNGGTSGPIEWIGLQDMRFNDNGDITPVGTKLNASDGWREFEFDPVKQTATAFLNGDNLVTSTFGVLEHIAIAIDPESDNPTGPFDVYIDNIQQFDDILVAGTSQGILLSQDFGSSWELSRLTQTPIHKFYKARNNRFLWAISANQVFLSTDPATWFATQGTTGIKYIRDIVEDSDGNMFISTEKGVYWFETALINTFSSWRQTQPINAFSTDCYGMYYNNIASGLNEIWVSTELGIYKTLDQGQSWLHSGWETAGLPAFQLMNIGNQTIVGITTKHIVRMMDQNIGFETIANMDEQHNLQKLWQFEFFNDHLYLSTEDGIYKNTTNNIFENAIQSVLFDKVFPQIDVNGIPVVAFGLNAVTSNTDGSKKLFIGLENRLLTVDTNNYVSTRREYSKEIPSFFLDNTEIVNGYIYNAFNNVLIFREAIPTNVYVKCAYLPRKKYIASLGGWAQQNAAADVFVYVNGLPKWMDFQIDTVSTLESLSAAQTNTDRADGKLNSYNSLIPDAENELLALQNMNIGRDNSTQTITADNIRDFLSRYTRFQSLISSSIASLIEVNTVPAIKLLGFSKQNRSNTSRAAIFESQHDFTSGDSTGIIINSTNGEIDFLTVFTTATDDDRKSEFIFSKYDQLLISIFNVNVSNTGELTHTELENKFESRNTGLTSHLTACQSANLIKMGIFLDRQNPSLFTNYRASNVQSQFYSAINNEWYDIVNSSVDYENIISTSDSDIGRFINVLKPFTDDPYYGITLLAATDKNIIQFTVQSDGTLEHVVTWQPQENCDVRDLFISSDNTIYAVIYNSISETTKIMYTSDTGETWLELDTINLPEQIHRFGIINNTFVASTDQGMYYSDNAFGTWYAAEVLPSISNNSNDSLSAFRQRIRNLNIDIFSICESDGWFFVTSNGLQWIALKNQMTLNSVQIVNQILRFKNLTWIATDHGLYNDSNSVLSDAIQFGLQSEMDNAIELHISDLTYIGDAVFCCAGNVIYRYFDNTWKAYTVDSFATIHKLAGLQIDSQTKYLFVTSYNEIMTINVSPLIGVFE